MIRVEKYGGSSVSTITKIKQIASHIKEEVLKGNKLVVVFSAMGKTTDEFIDLINQTANNPDKREIDQLLVLGEIKSIALGALALNDIGVKSISLSAKQIPITAYGKHQNSLIKSIDKKKILSYFEQYDVLFVAGFQGITNNNDYATLGRGGSDTTAVALAKILDAPCYIYTDVNAVYAVDPKIVNNAKSYSQIPYETMLEMASLGSGVLIPRSVALAYENNVKLYLLGSLEEKGTKIVDEYIETIDIIGISKMDGYSLITLNQETFFTNASVIGDIKPEMINVSSNKISFITNDRNVKYLQKITDQLKVINGVSKVSVVGNAITSKTNNIKKVIEVLSRTAVVDYHISTSELAISCVIKTDLSVKVVEELAKIFNITKEK